MIAAIVWAIWCAGWAVFWFVGAVQKYEPEPITCAFMGIFAIIFGVVPLLAS